MDSIARYVFVVGLVLTARQECLGAQIDIEPREALVLPDHNVTFMCRVAVPLQYCRIEIPGMQPLNLNEKLSNSDGVSYYGNGLAAGQCGFTMHRVTDRNNGAVKCFLGINTEAQESTGTMQLIVARAPRTPELDLSRGADSLRVYKINDVLEASCIVKDGRPVANISWYLNDDPLYGDGLSMPTVVDLAKENLQSKLQNLTRILQASDNGKNLKCVAYHPAYQNGRAETFRQLDVKYAPLQQPELDKFGYTLGQPGVITVVIEANPRPKIEWDIGGERIREGQVDQTGRIEAEAAKDLGLGKYEVNLRIAGINKHDTEKIFVLRAYNDMGGQDFNVKISTSPEPEGLELGLGGILGIVLSILIILLVVFILIFAKFTGRWCFSGPPDSRNLGESSDTESADVRPKDSKNFPPIKLTQFFKKKDAKTATKEDEEQPENVDDDDVKIPLGEAETADEANKEKEGLVYAELDLISPNVKPVVKTDDEKTEYAEIVYTPKETEEKK